MIKKIEIYFNSFKSSVLRKPTALAMFVAIVIVVTVACGLPSRMFVSAIEEDIYMDSLGFEQVVEDDFIYYKDVADLMVNLDDNGAFDPMDKQCSIGVQCYNYSITNAKGIETVFDWGRISLEVFPNYFNQRQIKDGEQLMIVGDAFLEKYDAKIGEVILFGGSEFLLWKCDSNMNNENSFSIPYSATITEFEPDVMAGLEPGKYYENNNSYFLGGLSRNLTTEEKSMIEDMGFEFLPKSFNTSALQAALLLILFLIGGMVNIVLVTTHWQKMNDQKYAIYKVIGAKPALIGGIMLAETAVLALIGVGVGVVIDYLISLMFVAVEISHMLWLHYLFLFSSTMLMVLITVAVKIIKRAKAVPVDNKFLS